MALNTPTRVPLDHRQLLAVRQSLHDIFGVDFNLWLFDKEWWRITEDKSCPLTPAQSTEVQHLDLVRSGPGKPMYFLNGPEEGGVLVIPLPKQHRRWFAATARFEASQAESFDRLARLFIKDLVNQDELVRLRQEHEAFLRQVTNDFEELTFLRSMASLLEISDLSFDFKAMGESMLPTLKPLVESDALILIPASDRSKSPDGRTVTVMDPCVWTGSQCIPQEICVNLVQKFRQAATSQPVVKNNFQRLPEASAFPGVNSFILVPIASGDVTIGWLLAVNRNNERNLNAGELPWELSYLEFGTHEATLMSSSAAILATHARNLQLFSEREELLVSVVRALVSAVEAKDEYTRGHSERVALYGKRIAQELGVSKDHCERLYLTGVLHDVGKIGVRDAVLRKPGPLTDEEFEEIKQHPDMGWQILQDLEPLAYVLQGVLYHHEQFDGRGYPDNLVGSNIPLDGRILAVADAYDAMTSDRPYRAGMPHEKAESILRAGAGKQWDPDVVEAFFRCISDILAIKAAYRPRASRLRKGVASAL